MMLVILSLLLFLASASVSQALRVSGRSGKIHLLSPKLKSGLINHFHRRGLTHATTTFPPLYQSNLENDLLSREPSASDRLKAWISLDTRGGVLVWSVILTAIPYAVYSALVSSGLDSDKVGAYVGSLFVLLSCVLWASTYIFRVANKDMTYAQQLRDYENAVLKKRLEELADDEIQALMEEIELEDEKINAPKQS